MDFDDDLQLPGDTLAILNEFLAEKARHEEELTKLKSLSPAITESAVGPITMDAFKEDWQQSQFWYTDETQRVLADELIEGIDKMERDVYVAVVSAPSVFVKLMAEKDKLPPNLHLYLLEYDRRFSVFGEKFIYYDFKHPLDLPKEFKGRFERFIVDPPYLFEETQTKVALTVRWLTDPKYKPRIMICTGERMKELVVNKLYKANGVKPSTLPVEHNQLQNELIAYANYEPEHGRWKLEDWKPED